MPTPKKDTTLAQLQALVSGIPKHCAGQTFVLSGQTYTAAQAAQLAANVLAAMAAVDVARGALTEAVQTRTKVLATDGKVVADLRQVLLVMLSSSPVALAELEISPPKPRAPLTVEAQVLKQAKANATRVVRGTKSKKQKSKIFGNVTGVTITPKTEPDE